ncbi:hypothetical protein ASF43_08615 [Pseudorhodoferax sp. Leaf267]|nr:hypothetical protein ASF43_08615 [Pseudorhodoferax sp. Leaf267]
MQEPRALVLARELGLTGMGARELIRQVGDAVGPQRMAQQRLALLHRMDACHYATAELVDMLRMWGREDFAQDRTTTVGGLRFADTEIALFALVAHA